MKQAKHSKAKLLHQNLHHLFFQKESITFPSGYTHWDLPDSTTQLNPSSGTGVGQGSQKGSRNEEPSFQRDDCEEKNKHYISNTIQNLKEIIMLIHPSLI